MSNRAAKSTTAPPVVKARAYPMDATLEQNGQKIQIQVVRLTKAGLIAKIKVQLVQVGHHYQIQFELPVLHHSIQTPVRVFKTYDKSVDPKLHKVERMAEFHFTKLTEEQTKNISAFLAEQGSAK